MRRYPQFNRTPNHVKSLQSVGEPVAEQQTVAPRRLRRMGLTPMQVMSLPNYGSADTSGVKPWLYRSHTHTLGAGFVRTA